MYQDPKIRFGMIVKNARALKGMDKGEFAELVREINHQFVNCVEHGCAPPERRTLVRMVRVLELSNREENEAFRLLAKFCSRRKARFKIHWKYSTLRRRHAQR